MVTPREILRNRQNSLRSTGPKSVTGKARSSLNAVRSGFFANTIVLPALGESLEQWEAFRSRIADDLGPSCEIEDECVDRIAAILWRLRRVLAYESVANVPADLPPHPDDISPQCTLTCLPPGPDAPRETRLAYLKYIVARNRHSLELARAAVALLGSDMTPREDQGEHETAQLIVQAAGDLMGWNPFDRPSPWEAVLKSIKVDQPESATISWTWELMDRAIDHVSGIATKTKIEFRGVIRERLLQESNRLQNLVEKREHELQQLTNEMLIARSQAATVSLYSDEKAIARLTQVESHLSRELSRAVAFLESVRACRKQVNLDRLIGLCRQFAEPKEKPVSGFVLGGEPENRIDYDHPKKVIAP